MFDIFRERLREQGSIVISVKVKTGASRRGIKDIKEERWKIDIQSPPEKGKANRELISLLASKFNVSENNVKIITGKRSPSKMVKIQK